MRGRCRCDKLADIHWPAGFMVLRHARDHGAEGAPSAAGRTGMAVLRGLGSLQDVAWPAHRPLLALLYEKAASSGMTWWKRLAAQLRQRGPGRRRRRHRHRAAPRGVPGRAPRSDHPAVLLTTFARTLADAMTRRLELLTVDPAVLGRIEVLNVDRLALPRFRPGPRRVVIAEWNCGLILPGIFDACHRPVDTKLTVQ